MTLRDILRAARRQGWTIEKTKKGLRFVPPDPTKEAVQWHHTPSDVRAIWHFVALMRRSGFQWPPK
jgi:hypothetical protein